MTLNTPGFKVTLFFDAECLRNGTRYQHSFNGIPIETYICPNVNVNVTAFMYHAGLITSNDLE